MHFCKLHLGVDGRMGARVREVAFSGLQSWEREAVIAVHRAWTTILDYNWLQLQLRFLVYQNTALFSTFLRSFVHLDHPRPPRPKICNKKSCCGPIFLCRSRIVYSVLKIWQKNGPFMFSHKNTPCKASRSSGFPPAGAHLLRLSACGATSDSEHLNKTTHTLLKRSFYPFLPPLNQNLNNVLKFAIYWIRKISILRELFLLMEITHMGLSCNTTRVGSQWW